MYKIGNRIPGFTLLDGYLDVPASHQVHFSVL
jgi:hypothetical protein